MARRLLTVDWSYVKSSANLHRRCPIAGLYAIVKMQDGGIEGNVDRACLSGQDRAKVSMKRAELGVCFEIVSYNRSRGVYYISVAITRADKMPEYLKRSLQRSFGREMSVRDLD